MSSLAVFFNKVAYGRPTNLQKQSQEVFSKKAGLKKFQDLPETNIKTPVSQSLF